MNGSSSSSSSSCSSLNPHFYPFPTGTWAVGGVRVGDNRNDPCGDYEAFVGAAPNPGRFGQIAWGPDDPFDTGCVSVDFTADARTGVLTFSPPIGMQVAVSPTNMIQSVRFFADAIPGFKSTWLNISVQFFDAAGVAYNPVPPFPSQPPNSDQLKSAEYFAPCGMTKVTARGDVQLSEKIKIKSIPPLIARGDDIVGHIYIFATSSSSSCSSSSSSSSSSSLSSGSSSSI